MEFEATNPGRIVQVLSGSCANPSCEIEKIDVDRDDANSIVVSGRNATAAAALGCFAASACFAPPCFLPTLGSISADVFPKTSAPISLINLAKPPEPWRSLWHALPAVPMAWSGETRGFRSRAQQSKLAECLAR